MPSAWAKEKVEYLHDSWGTVSIPGIIKKLNVSYNAILLKAQREGLGPFLESGDYITVNQLFKAIGRKKASSYTLKNWIAKGLPVKMKQVNDCKFKVIYIDDFWKWAEEYKSNIDFSKFEELALGKEPEWVREQRKADIQYSRYKTTPWTKDEDQTFISLIKLYRYTYRDISIMMKRSEGALRRRITDLNLKEWPLREPPHGIWSEEEIKTVIDMYNRGYKTEVIKEYISKSAHSIEGKIYRLIDEGRLEKRKTLRMK